LVGLSFGLSVGLPVGLSVRLLFGQSVGRSIGRSVCRFAGRSVDLLVCQLVCWLVCLSVWWCVGWCVGWCVNRSVGQSVMANLGSGYVSPQLHRYCTPQIEHHWVMSSQLQSGGPVWALTLIATLSRACTLHKGMLWGVKLGMLWDTLKSTFCHGSFPNGSYSKNAVYPRIKHDAESLKYSYVPGGTAGYPAQPGLI
jgi:hypothetical protein